MPGSGKKMLMWLGLADAEEYDDYEPYEEMPAPQVASVRRGGEPFEAVSSGSSGSSGSPAVRTLPRDGQDPAAPINLRVAPSNLRSLPTPAPSARVHVASPIEFADAQEIADRFRTGQPVIVNLGNAYRELAHRMIDFCSGVAYALGGSMDKVAEKVFLMTPNNVEVSAEEKRRLQERGLYRS